VVAVAGVGLASVLVVPPGLSLSVSIIAAFVVSWDGAATQHLGPRIKHAYRKDTVKASDHPC
jgi:hypothetical protein